MKDTWLKEFEGFVLDSEPVDFEKEVTDAEHPPGPVRTLEDMSDAEIAALEKRYGCPVRRPARKRAS